MKLWHQNVQPEQQKVYLFLFSNGMRKYSIVWVFLLIKEMKYFYQWSR